MSSKYIFKIAFIVITITFLQGISVASADELSNKINSLLVERFQPSDTGAVFLVAKDGVPIYRKAFGKANLELDVDMKPETNVYANWLYDETIYRGKYLDTARARKAKCKR